MVAFSTIKVGDLLWDCHKTSMGNTTMRRMGSWIVKIIEVHTDKREALVSWNGNAPKIYGERDIQQLRRSKHKDSR